MFGQKKHVRVRFAPSPTGPLNFGGVRTALFNWLFAKHEGGYFILRIEDTDKERSRPEFETDIKESLSWLGLHWDELYKQTDRIAEYEKYLTSLLERNIAYYCFCSEEDLVKDEEAQMSQGIPPKYSGRCRTIPFEEATARAKKEKHVIRLKVPEKELSFHDLIRGKVTFHLGLVGDFIIAKSLKEPLYNFANVIDDAEMEITHVVRGEEHISNTPRQIAIQEALGFSPLIYAHLPLILGANKKKLSKRDLAKSISDYRREGYLPHAVLNFLVLLGWHPKEDKEILSIEEMQKEFSFDRVQKAGGIFNIEKLDWFNGYYIRALSDETLALLLEELVPPAWMNDRNKFVKTVSVEKERMKKLTDFAGAVKFLFELPVYAPELLLWKHTPAATIAGNLKEAIGIFEGIAEEDFHKRTIESKMMLFAEMRGRGEVLWPIRVALSGNGASPGPFDLADILGKRETLLRMKHAYALLSKKHEAE